MKASEERPERPARFTPSPSTLLVIALLLLIVAWQVPFIVRGDYSRRLVWDGQSLDGDFSLEVRVRARFPAFDILEPDGTAYFIVVNRVSGKQAAVGEVPMNEILDFPAPGGPVVHWTSNTVTVTRLDESDLERTVRLQF